MKTNRTPNRNSHERGQAPRHNRPLPPDAARLINLIDQIDALAEQINRQRNRIRQRVDNVEGRLNDLDSIPLNRIAPR